MGPSHHGFYPRWQVGPPSLWEPSSRSAPGGGVAPNWMKRPGSPNCNRCRREAAVAPWCLPQENSGPPSVVCSACHIQPFRTPSNHAQDKSETRSHRWENRRPAGGTGPPQLSPTRRSPEGLARYRSRPTLPNGTSRTRVSNGPHAWNPMVARLSLLGVP